MVSEYSMDEKFLFRLTQILEAALEDERFGVKELAREAGLSKSQLLRKLQALKNKSTSQFIREFRLQKAMELLEKQAGTASEISYRVGFGSPTYFSTCFHEYFGYPPGEVKIRKNAGNGVDLHREGNSKRENSKLRMENFNLFLYRAPVIGSGFLNFIPGFPKKFTLRKSPGRSR